MLVYVDGRDTGLKIKLDMYKCSEFHIRIFLNLFHISCHISAKYPSVFYDFPCDLRYTHTNAITRITIF